MTPKEIIDWLWQLVPTAQNIGTELLQPWRLYQIGIVAVAFAIAHLVSRRLDARIRDRLRDLEGIPRARLRFAVVMLGYMRAIIFLVLIALAIAVLREATWPSRSYLIAKVAALTAAWIAVGIFSRLVRSKAARRLFTWGAWSYVTLIILNIDEEVFGLLDRAAIDVGDVHLSLLLMLKAVVYGGALIMIAATASAAVEARLNRSDDLSPSMKLLAAKGATLAIYAIAVLIALRTIGFNLANLAILTGAVGLGIGFGLQKVVSNLVSGVLLLLDKSIKPGDVISLGETFGWIQNLGARYVSVLTRDGREYLIPNEDLITGQVVNWSHSSDLIRLDIHFGVSYASDPHAVRRIAVEAATTVPRVIEDTAPVCHVVGFGDSSIDFILRFWIKDPAKGLTNVRGAVLLALWDAFKANDIDIPYPRRDVSIRSEKPHRPPSQEDATPDPA